MWKTILSAVLSWLLAVVIASSGAGAAAKMRVSTYLDRHSVIVDKCRLRSTDSRDYPVYECPATFTVFGNMMNTISYEQKGPRLGKDGICGPVALANIAANFCRTFEFTPSSFDISIFSDDGGTNIRDYEDELEKLMNVEGCWKTSGFWFEPEVVKVKTITGFDRISLQSAVTPSALENDATMRPAIVTLDMNNGTVGHATTVVAILNDVRGCTVVHNTWGKQYHTPCEKFQPIARDMVRLKWIPYALHIMLSGDPLGAVCLKGKPCNLGKGIMWQYSDKLRGLGPPWSTERLRKLAELIHPVKVHRLRIP